MKIQSFRTSIARKKSKNSVNCNVNWNWMRRTAECCNSNWGRPRDRRNKWKLRGIRRKPKWKSYLEKGRRPMIQAPKRRMQRYENSKPNSGSLKRWVLLWQFLIERRDLWKIHTPFLLHQYSSITKPAKLSKKSLHGKYWFFRNFDNSNFRCPSAFTMSSNKAKRSATSWKMRCSTWKRRSGNCRPRTSGEKPGIKLIMRWWANYDFSKRIIDQKEKYSSEYPSPN